MSEATIGFPGETAAIMDRAAAMMLASMGAASMTEAQKDAFISEYMRWMVDMAFADGGDKSTYDAQNYLRHLLEKRGKR